MNKKKDFIFIALLIIAWLIFVGLSIEAGGYIVNFVVSLYNPDFVDKLYQKMDLTALYNANSFHFYSVYTFILIIAVMKACLFYFIIQLMQKINLQKPFENFGLKKIETISYVIFSIGLLSVIATSVVKNLQKKGVDVDQLTGFWADGDAFLLMSAVIYIIGYIYKKGVELQSENDLTI